MENRKHIWIINEYAGSPYYGQEFRHYSLGKELVRSGHKVTVISSSYSHLFRKMPEHKEENIGGVDYFWIKTFNYGAAHNKKRVLKWFIFMFKCFFLPFSLKKPDVIIVSPMAPFPILPAWILSRLYRAKLIYEVKDIWPLSLVEVGGFSSRHPFIKFMSWFEKFALTKSDVIVSNLQNYGEHIKNLNIDRSFEWISNGIDLDDVKQNIELGENIYSKIPRNSFIVGYIGSFGSSNAIDYFLEAIKLINNSSVSFLFLGDGEFRNDILKFSQEDKRIILLDKTDKYTAFEVMKECNLLFKGNPSHKLYEFGISPIKLFEYMLSGIPIIHSTNVVKDTVKLSNCGLSVEAQNPKAISDGIIKLYEMSEEERIKMGENGKEYVLEHFTYKKLAKKFEEIL